MSERAWWQDGIIYQIYPRSFQDSTGSGTGDLNGIRQRLDYVAGLGVDAIWISPIFPSPMADGGYDISDYTGIEPMFGTLEDFDALIEDAHARGLKVLLDFVPSHTSEAHPWFLNSRSSKSADKRDWYIWRDPVNGGPPTNWISEFGGPAWTLDDTTGQYYLHIYARQQPALNWRNPDVANAMLDAMRTWYDRGVDGFRVDAVEHLTPDAELHDNPPNPDWRPEMGPADALLRQWTAHQPEGYGVVREMRKVADAYPGRVLIGEAYGALDQVMKYYGEAMDGFHLPFNFELITAPWNADHILDYARRYEAALPEGAWPNWVLGNHDRRRIASRVGPAQARVAMMLLLTLRGTPTIYQGDELGLENAPIPAEAVQDPWERNAPGLGLGRDPVRAPLPWTDGAGGGFTTGRPWLPMPRGTSVEAQSGDAGSMLSLTHRLVALRRAEPALALGAWEGISARDGVLVYGRRHGDRRLVVALNLTPEDRPMPAPARGGRVLLSVRDGGTDPDVLRGDDGVIVAAD